MKKTKWYSKTIKPVRDGVYEVLTPNNWANKFAYFDKTGWRSCGRSIEQALSEKNEFRYHNLSSMTLKGSKWRGLTKEHK